MRLPRVELGSIAWKAVILTVGLQAQFDRASNGNLSKTKNIQDKIIVE